MAEAPDNPVFEEALRALVEELAREQPIAKRTLDPPKARGSYGSVERGIAASGAEGPNGEPVYAPKGTPGQPQTILSELSRMVREPSYGANAAFSVAPGVLGMTGGPSGAVLSTIKNPSMALNALGRVGGEAAATMRDFPNKLAGAVDNVTGAFRSANVTPAEEAMRAAAMRPPNVAPSTPVTPRTVRPDRPENLTPQPGPRGAENAPELVGPWGVKRPDTPPAWTAETQANREAARASEASPYVQLRKGDIGAEGNSGQFVSKAEQDAHLQSQVAQPRQQRLEAEREKLFMDEVRNRALEMERSASLGPAQPPTQRSTAAMSPRPAAQPPAPEMSPFPRNGLAQSLMENPVATGIGIGGVGVGGLTAYLKAVEAGLLPRPKWLGGPDTDQGNPNVQPR